MTVPRSFGQNFRIFLAKFTDVRPRAGAAPSWVTLSPCTDPLGSRRPRRSADRQPPLPGLALAVQPPCLGCGRSFTPPAAGPPWCCWPALLLLARPPPQFSPPPVAIDAPCGPGVRGAAYPRPTRPRCSVQRALSSGCALLPLASTCVPTPALRGGMLYCPGNFGTHNPSQSATFID